MRCIIKNLKKLIYLKRKQILFALFALLCYVFDNNNSNEILRAAAPAIVAGAAKTATIAKGAAAGSKAATIAKTASDGAKAKKVLDTANQAKSATDTMDSIKKSKSIKDSTDNFGSMRKLNSDFPKNTNPKYSGNNSSRNSMSSNIGSVSRKNDEDSQNNNEKVDNLSSESSESSIKVGKNYLMPPFVPTPINEDDDSEYTTDSVANDVIKKSPKMFAGVALGGFFLFVLFVPLVILGVINATSSTISELDCSRYDGENCKVEDSETSFFDKLLNLFKYGKYGSNSEVVIKEIEETYDEIKEEYDFIISIPLLASSIFSDAEYIETDVENGEIVITDKMLERVEYIEDVALLQLIPKYLVYSCNAGYVNGEYVYSETYEYWKTPTYTDEDTTEEEMELIPTGECNAATAGGIFKKVLYYFDSEKYFRRYKKSEELDLVYVDYVEADKLLVSKVQTQYYLYKHIYNIDEELEYTDVPLELVVDTTVNLASPLKGWYSITSPFGNREGEFAGMHNGIDLVASDKNIYSAGTGVVTRSNVETEGGNVIEITHTDKFGKQYVTQYAHLSERHVNVGDVVNSGDVIGIMGDTGTMASGVHLHFSMWDKETNEYYNPNKLFSEASNY